MKKFIKNRDGTHLHHPLMDVTLCGDTNDGDENSMIDVEPLRSTNECVVTCKRCIEIILYCRGVRVK